MRNDLRPDEKRDVIVHFVRELDERGAPIREHWMIYLGMTKAGERDSRESALQFATELAVRNDRPAWLLQESRSPLTPIDLESLPPSG